MDNCMAQIVLRDSHDQLTGERRLITLSAGFPALTEHGASKN